MKVNKYLFVTDREDMFIISRIKMINFRQSQICSTKVKKDSKGLIFSLKKTGKCHDLDRYFFDLYVKLDIKIQLHLINDYVF